MRHNRPPNQSAYGRPGRIAIWNRARVIIVIAVGIWVADILCALDGK